MNFKIEKMKKDQWNRIEDIYSRGLNTGKASFMHKPPTWEQWDETHLHCCRLIIKNNENILGWTALSPISSRECYSGVAEVSIYIDENSRKAGLGKKLLNALIQESEREGIWTLQSKILDENTQSLSLHIKCGFRIIGIREKMGRTISGEWKNVYLVERRSKKVGI